MFCTAARPQLRQPVLTYSTNNKTATILVGVSQPFCVQITREEVVTQHLAKFIVDIPINDILIFTLLKFEYDMLPPSIISLHNHIFK